jgi:hypothetical protein
MEMVNVMANIKQRSQNATKAAQCHSDKALTVCLFTEEGGRKEGKHKWLW